MSLTFFPLSRLRARELKYFLSFLHHHLLWTLTQAVFQQKPIVISKKFVKFRKIWSATSVSFISFVWAIAFTMRGIKDGVVILFLKGPKN
jgi:hypothetical protein